MQAELVYVKENLDIVKAELADAKEKLREKRERQSDGDEDQDEDERKNKKAKKETCILM